MRRPYLLLLAVLALVSCVELESATTDDSGQELKVSITINRSGTFDASTGTKATVKSGWNVGDVVFVFFKDVTSPKYLEIKRSIRGWTYTMKNGLTVKDLGEHGVMTAIYMPYGSDIEISGANGNFYFSSTYNGLFYMAQNVSYTVEDNELQGELDMSTPKLEGNDKYIHFDVTGYDKHDYWLYQDYVKPLTISGLNSFFDVKYYYGKSNDAIEGYVDNANGIVSFSGILDESAVGSAVDFEFSINDRTDQVLYTRDAGVRTLNGSKYIGIGDISDANRWNATEYVILTTMGGNDFCWAKRNLGATAERGEGSYGYFYSWCDLNGYPLLGTFKHYTCEHEFNPIPFVTPEDDVAHYALKGLWRMPSYIEMHALLDMFMDKTSGVYWIRQGTHGSLSFGHLFVNDNTGASVFLPGAGVVAGSTPTAQGQYGNYWIAGYNNLYLDRTDVAVEANGNDGCGRTIRPVFTVKSL